MMLGQGMMGGLFGGFGFIGMIFVFLFALVVIIGIILLIVWAVKRTSNSYTDDKNSDAIEILRKRYAKGEISKEDFENIKKDIS